jgi:dTMP kinase
MALLIAIEGIDGSGKGTQTGRLVESLRARGLRVESLQFPRYSATTFGKAVADFLNGRFGALHEVHPQLAATLYAGDRFESKGLLQEMLDRCDLVVLDRYVGSNLAHQGAKLEGGARIALQEWIEEVEFGVYGLPRPDVNILIDVTSSVSRELVARKGVRDYTSAAADLHESDLPYQDRVRRCYRELAERRVDWTLIPALDDARQLRSIDDIASDVLELVLSRLPGVKS